MAPSDTVREVPYSQPDTSQFAPPPPRADTIPPPGDTLPQLAPTVSPESLLAESLATVILPTVFHERVHIAKGPVDEVRFVPDLFVRSPGPVGSPAIPVEYLNVSDIEIKLNGLPFPYQGLYRPYVIGTDLNTIPWEILNDIYWNPQNDLTEGIDFRVGRPVDNSNRSDIDVARGAFGYEASHWRFFRPFGKKTYAYFTAGFNKSQGYDVNSNYNAFHVTGGISRKIGSGELSLDLWQHKANMGLASFDFLPQQLSGQRRTIDRGEARYKTNFKGRYSLTVTGLLQKNYQKITGYTSPVDDNYSVSGGRILLSDSTADRIVDGSFEFYRFAISKIAGPHSAISQVEPSVGWRGKFDSFDYYLKAVYSWNKADKSAILPAARLSYSLNKSQKPFVELLRSRRDPDLNLYFFNDNVTGLGVAQVLQSYRFVGNQNLSMPLTTQATVGLESDWGAVQSDIGVSLKRINWQIYLAYTQDSPTNFTVTPTNFDDTFLELFARAKGESGPISGEISGAYRKWSKRFFSDGLEKGPAALGFARLSYLREFFVRRLYLGGTLEARFSTRRDYRSLTPGFTGSYSSISGRLEFRYKDLTIWLSDENLLNSAFTTWWPYLETPRNVWLGFMWNFFD